MTDKRFRDVPRIYLDMDGPLADFDRYCADNRLDPEHAKLYGGTYLNLPVTEGANQAVYMMESLLPNVELFILSKIPTDNPTAATEKHHWCARHFPTLTKKIILSPDKGAVGSERDILIDDHPERANAEKFRGRVVKFIASDGWTPILAELGLLPC